MRWCLRSSVLLQSLGSDSNFFIRNISRGKKLPASHLTNLFSSLNIKIINIKHLVKTKHHSYEQLSKSRVQTKKKKLQKLVIHTVSNIGPGVDVCRCHFCIQQKWFIRDKHPHCLMLEELMNHRDRPITWADIYNFSDYWNKCFLDWLPIKKGKEMFLKMSYFCSEVK